MIEIFPKLQVSLGIYAQRFRTRQVIFLMNEATRSRLTLELCSSDRTMFLFEVSAKDGKLDRLFAMPVEIAEELSDNNVILHNWQQPMPVEKVRSLNNLMNGQKDNPDDLATTFFDGHPVYEGSLSEA